MNGCVGDFEIPAIGFGCMGLSEFYGEIDFQSSLTLLCDAYEYGYKHFDTADMYGRGKNESLLGNFLNEVGSSKRNDIFISTKAGIVRDADDQFSVSVNTSYNYIVECCEKSLERLNTDYIDLFYIHRLNPTMCLEDTLLALSDLKQRGVIRNVGLCEVNSETIRTANEVLQIAAIQSEYSLWTRHVEDDVLDTCIDLDIAFVAFSPLGRGFLTGGINKDTVKNKLKENDFRKRIPRFHKDNLVKNEKTLESLMKISEELGITPSQIALAWLLSKYHNIHAIPGTKNTEYMKQNFDALKVSLSEKVIAKLDSAFLPENVYGNRYPDNISSHSEK